MLLSDRPRLPLCSLREFGTPPIGCSNQSCKIVTDSCVTRVTLKERVGSQRPTPARRFRRLGGPRQEARPAQLKKTKANFALGPPFGNWHSRPGYTPKSGNEFARLADLPPEIRKNIEKITIDARGRAVPQLYSKLAANRDLREMLNIGGQKERPQGFPMPNSSSS
jgi:hypothetical protein